VYLCQYGLGYKVVKNKMANAENTNARGGIIQELLPAMKLVKYYAWERFFEAKVNHVRDTSNMEIVISQHC
jgi:ATP-binding cassette, subfamily C (CFTR/MRP), member 1